MMEQWMNAERRLELFDRLWTIIDELQAIAHFWWELDPDMQARRAPLEDVQQGDAGASAQSPSSPVP